MKAPTCCGKHRMRAGQMRGELHAVARLLSRTDPLRRPTDHAKLKQRAERLRESIADEICAA